MPSWFPVLALTILALSLPLILWRQYAIIKKINTKEEPPKPRPRPLRKISRPDPEKTKILPKDTVTNSASKTFRFLPITANYILLDLDTCKLGLRENPPQEQNQIKTSQILFCRINPGTYKSAAIFCPFYLSVFPVTQAQYAALAKAKPPTYQSPDTPVHTVSYEEISQTLLPKIRRRLPEQIHIDLPSEQQYEAVCQDIQPNDKEEAILNQARPVGQNPSHNGIYDLIGNVWEWTMDQDGQGFQIIKCGSFKSLPAQTKSNAKPEDKYPTLGFRLAITIDNPEDYEGRITQLFPLNPEAYRSPKKPKPEAKQPELKNQEPPFTDYQLDKILQAQKPDPQDLLALEAQAIKGDQQILKVLKSNSGRLYNLLGDLYSASPYANPKKALRYYKIAAIMGSKEAQCSLGECYKSGYGTAPSDKQAIKHFLASANQNNPKALNQLGLCYDSGEGLPSDEYEAFICYEKAAEQGNPAAQYNLGLIYKQGILDMPPDPDQAFIFFQQSAQNGFPEAHYELALCYKDGYGTQKDPVQAFQHFLIAARQNVRPAQKELSYCYKNGFGTKPDPNLALHWLEAATDNM